MACSCNQRRRDAANPVAGYEYTFQGVTTTFLSHVEAKVAQRRNGGGTILVKKRDG